MGTLGLIFTGTLAFVNAGAKRAHYG